MSGVPHKTFYLETFGCQMNVHDSEKVVGTLVQEGYRQVETVEAADLILYNTCSIRDKAEQKVFHRLADYKKLQAQGKKFGVLGCVAQQEGEKIFERAPHVSLVCGSASYRKLPEMLAQLEVASGAVAREIPRPAAAPPPAEAESLPENAGLRDDAFVMATAGKSAAGKPETASLVRITGLDDRQTDQCFETEFAARTNPHRGYITIIEGCDKFCAYCVVPFTRGKERSRTLGLGSGGSPADGRSCGYTRDSTARAEREFLQRSGREALFRRVAGCGRRSPGIRRVRFTTSHPRDFGHDIVQAMDAVPTLCDHVHRPSRAALRGCLTPCSGSIPASNIWSALRG